MLEKKMADLLVLGRRELVETVLDSLTTFRELLVVAAKRLTSHREGFPTFCNWAQMLCVDLLRDFSPGGETNDHDQRNDRLWRTEAQTPWKRAIRFWMWIHKIRSRKRNKAAY